MMTEQVGETADTEQHEPMTFGDKVRRELREWGVTIAIFVPVYLLFTTFLFELRSIPSESMVPNLQVGDRVLVNKFSYGYSRDSLPFRLGRILPLPHGRVFAKLPKRGDVVVFEHPHFKRTMIKRAIGLPGDRVQVINEVLYINGEPVELEYIGSRQYQPHNEYGSVTARVYEETLPGGKTHTLEQFAKGTKGDSTPVFVVPEGYVMFMGDNRDGSLDARDLSGHCPVRDGEVTEAGCTPAELDPKRTSIGFVPLDNIIGRASTVIFTFNRCKDTSDNKCPPGRVWKPL